MSEPEHRFPSNPITETPKERAQSKPDESLMKLARSAERRLLIKFGIFVVLAIVAFATARPLFREAKGWRSRMLAAESLQLLSQAKESEALAKARAAYMLSGNQPITLRAFALALNEQNDFQKAFPLWQRLLASGKASEGDRRAMAEAAVQIGNIAEAETQLTYLMAREALSSADCELAARIKLAKGEPDEAILEARQALKLQAGNESAQLLLGKMLLGGSPPMHEEGEQVLRQLGVQLHPGGLKALRALAADDSRLSIDSAKWAALALDAHPLANEQDHISALKLSLLGHPDQREDLLEMAQDIYASAQPEAFIAFAQLLADLHESKRLLSFIPEARALKNADLLLLRLDAFYALGQWEESVEVLQNKDVPLPKFTVFLFMARCEKELGKAPEADASWKAARALAGRDLFLLQSIITYAEKVGEPAEAEKARARLAQVEAAAAPAAPAASK